MALATCDHEAPSVGGRGRTRLRRAVMTGAVVLSAACGGSSSDPPSRPVTGGEVRLDVSPSFGTILAKQGVHLVWNPPPCSWRLVAPSCGGAATTDPASLAVPVVGGQVSLWKDGARVRGRIELAGRLELTSSRGTLSLDDLTLHPETSMLTAKTPMGWIDVLFLDGTVATFPSDSRVVEVKGVEVKLLKGLNEQIRSVLGVAESSELVKVGDLAMRVNTDAREGGR